MAAVVLPDGEHTQQTEGIRESSLPLVPLSHLLLPEPTEPPPNLVSLVQEVGKKGADQDGKKGADQDLQATTSAEPNLLSM
jgi:hypothetical protein